MPYSCDPTSAEQAQGGHWLAVLVSKEELAMTTWFKAEIAEYLLKSVAQRIWQPFHFYQGICPDFKLFIRSDRFDKKALRKY